MTVSIVPDTTVADLKAQIRNFVENYQEFDFGNTRFNEGLRELAGAVADEANTNWEFVHGRLHWFMGHPDAELHGSVISILLEANRAGLVPPLRF